MRLGNAEEAHREDPRTFSIPRRAVRETLRAGDFVKLLFVVDPPVRGVDVERMWAQVSDVADGRYRGTLENDPQLLTDLRPGHPIEFGPEHVVAKQVPPGDPALIDPAAFAVISRLVWDEGAWPSRLERRDLPDPTFSGWFVLAGTETSDYAANYENLVPATQAELLDRFPVLDSGLEGDVGTVMVWSETELEYQHEPQWADAGEVGSKRVGRTVRERPNTNRNVKTELTRGRPVVIRREWPWGLAFIRDSDWTEPVPIEWLDQDLVLARGGEIVAKILHQTDGEASVEITTAPPSDLVFVSRCELDVPSGTLVVTDAAEEQIDQVSVAAGRWEASVWMDRADHPSRIALVLRQAAPEDSA